LTNETDKQLEKAIEILLE